MSVLPVGNRWALPNQKLYLSGLSRNCQAMVAVMLVRLS